MIEESFVLPCVFLSYSSVGNVLSQPEKGSVPNRISEEIVGVQGLGACMELCMGKSSIFENVVNWLFCEV